VPKMSGGEGLGGHPLKIEFFFSSPSHYTWLKHKIR
jgi:hypothetical protein